MKHQCGCDAGGHKPLLPVDDARKQLLASAECLVAPEPCALKYASGRVLAQSLVASVMVPPLDNSAMDGYALCHDELPDSRVMSVSQRIPAGAQPDPLQPGTCCRIFTGAPMPRGADTVVMQEHVVCQEDGSIRFPPMIHPESNVRYAGEDLMPGDHLLNAGVRLGPAECGVLASQGVGEVMVYRRLKVAILSTGDELIQPGVRWTQGKLYNSNRYTLAAGIESLGMEVVELEINNGIVPDTPEDTRAALLDASERADVIISTGGVSVGEEDYVRLSVEALGEINLWGIAIKPGKPFAFGQVQGTPFLGLPGNPAAAMVTFDLLASAYLKRCQGRSPQPLRRFSVASGFSRDKTLSRQEYIRASLISGDKSQPGSALVAVSAGDQGSGVLSTACLADGYLVIPPATRINKGERYDFLSYADFRW
ncbi:gephyrin-like molybdotransferase Glp [Nitrincola alkalilacustris]|uniref:molybdopterin molybdotransferase MoeA n=1 Tax=Nitrincola alkalilacustris TaxID=1571224 RepID=UPI00124D5B32|nr:gephyrin-like molybdotransferase Glp [Nitrincola alkalilacustris]